MSEVCGKTIDTTNGKCCFIPHDWSPDGWPLENPPGPIDQARLLDDQANVLEMRGYGTSTSYEKISAEVVIDNYRAAAKTIRKLQKQVEELEGKSLTAEEHEQALLDFMSSSRWIK